MNTELPLSTGASDRLRLRDADVYLIRDFMPMDSADGLAMQLIEEVPWRKEQIVVWGRRLAQPRLVAWYGDKGRSYAYSGIRLDPLPWTRTLWELKAKVEAKADSPFNSVLLNFYRDCRDSMGLHSDDEKELGERPVIASLSLGEVRTLIFKHKIVGGEKPVHLKLPSGSLLVMKGDTQKNWKHGIDKEARLCGPRVNLTFRKIEL
jgi:alkylated DNA repair dioxygenase AlkB